MSTINYLLPAVNVQYNVINQASDSLVSKHFAISEENVNNTRNWMVRHCSHQGTPCKISPCGSFSALLYYIYVSVLCPVKLESPGVVMWWDFSKPDKSDTTWMQGENGKRKQLALREMCFCLQISHLLFLCHACFSFQWDKNPVDDLQWFLCIVLSECMPL